MNIKAKIKALEEGLKLARKYLSSDMTPDEVEFVLEKVRNDPLKIAALIDWMMDNYDIQKDDIHLCFIVLMATSSLAGDDTFDLVMEASREGNTDLVLHFIEEAMDDDDEDDDDD